MIRPVRGDIVHIKYAWEDHIALVTGPKDEESGGLVPLHIWDCPSKKWIIEMCHSERLTYIGTVRSLGVEMPDEWLWVD